MHRLFLTLEFLTAGTLHAKPDGYMTDQRIKDALEWKIHLLAFEFQNVPVEEVHDMIRIAWQFSPDTMREREELPRAS